MIMQMIFKNIIFSSVKQIFQCSQRKKYCVTCTNATQKHLVEYRFNLNRDEWHELYIYY